MAKGDSSKMWSMFSLVAALGAAAAARKAIDKSWQVSTGKKPPENPADPDVDIWEAVAWAATDRRRGGAGQDVRPAPRRDVLRQVDGHAAAAAP